jgi:hypothetical protein
MPRVLHAKRGRVTRGRVALLAAMHAAIEVVIADAVERAEGSLGRREHVGRTRVRGEQPRQRRQQPTFSPKAADEAIDGPDCKTVHS